MAIGEQCTWTGPMANARYDPAADRFQCPNCAGNLTEAPDIRSIEIGTEAFELGVYASVNPPPRPHPGYRGLVRWMMEQEHCWDSIEAAADAYRQATGKYVDPTR
jgi:hypothetical protein